MVIYGISEIKEKLMYTIEETKEVLKNQIKKGDTVHTITRQVSASGMYRHISVIVKSGEDLLNQSYNIAKLLGYTYKDKTNSVGVSGGKRDMGFALVYNLSHELYGDGYAIKQRWL